MTNGDTLHLHWLGSFRGMAARGCFRTAFCSQRQTENPSDTKPFRQDSPSPVSLEARLSEGCQEAILGPSIPWVLSGCCPPWVLSNLGRSVKNGSK